MPSPVIFPDSAVVEIEYPGTTGMGQLVVRDVSLPLAQVRLQAESLKIGDNNAFVHFPGNSDKDNIWLNAACPNFPAVRPCLVAYQVSSVRAVGTYQGTIGIYSTHEKLGAVTIAAARNEPTFQPSVSGDLVKNGSIEFDSTTLSWFVFTVQSPVGTPSRRVRLRDCSDEQATECTDPVAALKAELADRSKQHGILYVPSVFDLRPGKPQIVKALVPRFPEPSTYARFLQVADADEASLTTTTLVTVKQLESPKIRKRYLLYYVVLGALISVALNNIFPVSRAKADALSALRRISESLDNCVSIGAALRDVLMSEIGRNRLIARGIRFFHLDKDASIQDIQQATTLLASLVTAAKSIATLRSQVESDALPVRSKLAIEALLSCAEDTLITFDATTASAQILQASKIRAASGVTTSLAEELARDIKKLLDERGNPLGGQPAPAAGESRTAEAIQNSADFAIRSGRSPRIALLIAQLERDLKSVSSMKLDELLEVERDFYVADVWTEFAEPAIGRDKALFDSFAHEILECLTRNPTSAHVQLLLALIRSSLTPSDLEAALQRRAGRIECNPRPRYLELIDFHFVFTNPCIAAVAAARRMVSYKWDFNDQTPPPEDFERCKHYFPLPRVHWLPIPRKIKKVVVNVTLRGEGERGLATFEQILTLRKPGTRASELGMMQFMSFALSTSVAVLAAFASQYGGVLPDTIDFKTAVAAFMFGFGIDQIRDKTTSAQTPRPPSPPTTTPSTPPATVKA